MIDEVVDQLMDFYPRIYFACHTRHVYDPANEVKLTANQVSILDHLDPEDPVTLYDLALHMGVTPSTMSITINRLIDLDYVTRRKSAIDARKLELRLTKSGVRIKKSKSVLDFDRVKAMLRRLSAKEQKIAIKGLGLLAMAADMEMKSRSLSKSWSKRSRKKDKGIK